MERPRRNHSAAFKARVAVAAIRGDKTLAEPAEHFEAHANQIAQWKSLLLEPCAVSEHSGSKMSRLQQCSASKSRFPHRLRRP